MSISHKWISALATAAALSLVTLSSNAAEPVGNAAGLSKTVKAWDLDLAKAEDVQKLRVRVREAANDVCTAEARRHYASTRRYPELGWRERCVNDAVEAAVRDVGNRRMAMDTTGRALF